MSSLATRRLSAPVILAALAGGATTAHAANYSINWLSFAPTPVGSSVPNNSSYFVPGVGNVGVSYNISGDFVHVRQQHPFHQNGNVSLGPDNWSWGNQEQFAATLLTGPDPLVPVSWDVTFTFPSTLAAGSVFVGVSGLGQTTSSGGGATVATVTQNGTFLGDWNGGGNWGPTQFTGGPGIFSMQNSLTGAGGADPHWNTPLGVVRIDDAVSSITVRFSHIRGDGAGANVGFIPAPGAAALLGLAGLTAARRRR